MDREPRDAIAVRVDRVEERAHVRGGAVGRDAEHAAVRVAPQRAAVEQRVDGGERGRVREDEVEPLARRRGA